MTVNNLLRLTSLTGIVLLQLFFQMSQVFAEVRDDSVDSATQIPELTDDLIQDLLHDDFLGLYFADNKTGWAHYTLNRFTTQKVDVWRLTFFSEFRLVSDGISETFTTIARLDFDTAPPYRVNKIREIQRSGGGSQIIDISCMSDQADVEILSSIDTSRKTLPPIHYSLADYLQDRMWIRAGAQPGESLTGKHFATSELELRETSAKIVSIEEMLVNGVQMPIYTIEYYDPSDKTTILSRFDQNGNNITSSFSSLLELKVEPEAVAKDLDAGFDLFNAGKVSIDKSLGDSLKFHSLQLRMSGNILPRLPDASGQTVMELDDALLIQLGPEYGSNAPVSQTEQAKYLEASITIPSDHATIRQMALDIITDADDDLEKVHKLVAFTYHYIDGGFTSQPMSVWDILKSRSGDCSEYSLLFTTLARAAGLPARSVSGLMYMGDEHRSFGAHAWNEVVVNDRWLPVDAAWGETTVSLKRIRFNDDEDGDAAAHDNVAMLSGLHLQLINAEVADE